VFIEVLNNRMQHNSILNNAMTVRLL